MKKILAFSITFAFILPFIGGAQIQAQTKKKVAVYVAGDADENDKKVIANTMISALTMSSDYVAVERMNEFMDALNKEIDNQTSGAVRDRDIANIGQQFGAKYVDVIEVSEMRDELYVAARMVDVESAAVIASYQNSAPIETMEQLRQLARDIASHLLSLMPNGQYSSTTPSSPRQSFPMYNGQNRTFTVNGISFVMVAVPGGNFMMGSNNGDSDEQPVHNEYVRDFMIGQTEVTQELWRAVMGSNPSSFGGEKNPVEMVSFSDCIEFISRLNQITGQRFRLPTEAEWEYAARGGNKSNNYTYSGGNDIYMSGWSTRNSGGRPHQVATLQPNELGIYDMSGNVYEWTSDVYSSNYNAPRNSSHRVIRGGCWADSAIFSRVASRVKFIASDRDSFLGLRLAL